ncbi:hypothetical protein M0R45_015467 [Rubus argutus]|uniref:Uncharacterized protein n=1 Tax=Rubus argutus TaxID=59490 RepID=A0AAW1XS61_RUBAR
MQTTNQAMQRIDPINQGVGIVEAIVPTIEVEDTNISITCEDDKKSTDDPVMDELTTSNDDYGKVNLLMHRNIPIKQSIAIATVETIIILKLKPLLSGEYLDMGADMERSIIHGHHIVEYILTVETKAQRVDQFLGRCILSPC